MNQPSSWLFAISGVLHVSSIDLTKHVIQSHFGCMDIFLVKEAINCLIDYKTTLHLLSDIWKGCKIYPVSLREWVI